MLKSSFDNPTDGEEADVAEERAAVDLEGLDDAHGAHDARRDERGGAEQLPNGEPARVGAHGGESGEHVRAAVAEGEEGDAGDVLVEAEEVGDGAEVGAEEVGGADA